MNEVKPSSEAAIKSRGGSDGGSGDGRPQRIVAANWKMHKTPAEASIYCNQLRDVVAASSGALAHSADGCAATEVVIFPSALSAMAVADGLRGSSFRWGLQNIFAAENFRLHRRKFSVRGQVHGRKLRPHRA